jgi:hypothetical protein
MINNKIQYFYYYDVIIKIYNLYKINYLIAVSSASHATHYTENVVVLNIDIN